VKLDRENDASKGPNLLSIPFDLQFRPYTMRTTQRLQSTWKSADELAH
jgi:hypothetical protein